MDEMQNMRLTQSCAKVFIHRDYGEGIAVKFETKLPQELNGKVKLCLILMGLNQLLSFFFYLNDLDR